MTYFHKLETNTKLYASFFIVFCTGALLAIGMLLALADLVSGAARQPGLSASAAALLHADFAAVRNWAGAFLAGGGAVAVVLAIWLAAQIARPMHEAVIVARRVATGDLTTRIESGAGGEAGLLMDAMQEMNDKLVGIIVNVRNGTATIASGAGEIASGNMDLSARTEQQAASLEETASSMEELTATVKQNADHAHQASKLAVSASEVAVKGGEVVAEVVGTMASINDSSKRISEIIGVIDGIAFQTNILALNAAVEAARAGEQGRGFAVVASEVRNLAQRSAAAAKEIKVLIDDSVDKVNAGTQLADKAGNTMNEVVTSVKRVTEIIGEIASASAEQTTGIEQVNQAIAAMDQATQQNAALVEESAAAATSMREQAISLSRVIGAFVLAAEHNRPATPIHLIASNPGKPAGRKKEARARPPVSPVAPSSPRSAAAAPLAAAAAAPRESRRSATNADLDWEEF